MKSIDERINELRDEYKSGQEQLKLLEARQQELANTLLRISGAIQVLEEMKADEKNIEGTDSSSQ